MNRCGPKTRDPRKLSDTPRSRSVQRTLTGQPDNLRSLPRRDNRRTPLSRLMLQSVHSVLEETLPPLQSILFTETAFQADFPKSHAVRGQKYDLRPTTQTLFCLMPNHPHAQGGTLFVSISRSVRAPRKWNRQSGSDFPAGDKDQGLMSRHRETGACPNPGE